MQARGRIAKTSSVGGSRQLPRRGSREQGLQRPLSSAYADTFPATVGFFALFSLRRKSEKGESKKEYRHNGTGEACQKGKARMWVEYKAAF